MKSIITAFLFLCFFASCNITGETIKGNGNQKSENREVSNVSKINVMGSLEVVLMEGSPSIKIEGDENILPYIETNVNGNELTIKTKDHINIQTNNSLKIYVSLQQFSELKIMGSGKIETANKFNNNEKFTAELMGSGKIILNVHAPSVVAEVMGSGDIIIEGETRDVEANIKGSGTFTGENLKAENAVVSIAGSGDVTVFADVKLKINIAGSGNVKYRGNASVEKSIAGSGNIEQLQ